MFILNFFHNKNFIWIYLFYYFIIFTVCNLNNFVYFTTYICKLRKQLSISSHSITSFKHIFLINRFVIIKKKIKIKVKHLQNSINYTKQITY